MSDLKAELDQVWKRLTHAQRALERCQEQLDATAMSLHRVREKAVPPLSGNDNDQE